MKILKSLYINNRFFYVCIGIILLFIFSFLFPVLLQITQLLLVVVLGFFILDIFVLYSKKEAFKASRVLPEKFSNGDENPVIITLQNFFSIPIFVTVIDEIPEQFQIRNFNIIKKIKPSSKLDVNYKLRPTERGEYKFGKLNVYVNTVLGLVAKRYTFNHNAKIATYPSFIQLRKYNLLAMSNNLQQYGVKKVRKLGHTLEFEQIKEYVLGDDLRTINWKATAKRNQIMVNQFQDEKSQPVYCIIDKGRVMKMPFNGLTLLDYAINASLVICNVALKKQDKAGLFTFSNCIENRVVAERRTSQMNLVLDTLYNVTTNFKESDFGRLYANVKRHLTQRSLLLLFTNFETLDSLNRQLPYLKGLAKSHLLVVVFFKNTELNHFIKLKAETTQHVYDKVIAEKFVFEKRLIVNELKKYGIYSVLTTPEDLTIDTINKYLELKARGLL